MRQSSVTTMVWDRWVEAYKMPDSFITFWNQLYAIDYHSERLFRIPYLEHKYATHTPSGSLDPYTENHLLQIYDGGDVLIVYERNSGGRSGQNTLAYRALTEKKLPSVIKKYTSDLRAFAIYRRIL